MAYEKSGTLTTDKRTVSISETWETQTDWEAYQSASNVDISNGVVTLAEAATIPDNAVHRWILDENTGTVAGDSIGSSDLSFSDVTWVSNAGTYQGDVAVSLDGVDDSGSTNSLATVSVSSSFAIGLTVNPDDATTTQQVLMQQRASNDRVAMSISENASGEFEAGLYDGSFIGSRSADMTGFSGLLRVLYQWDSSSNTGTLYFNTSSVDDSSNNPNFAGQQSDVFRVGKSDVDDRYYSGVLDDLIVYDGVLTSSEIQADYDAQPWT